jgi:hypothetical protein
MAGAASVLRAFEVETLYKEVNSSALEVIGASGQLQTAK